MKRFWLFLILTALLLSGCGAEPEAEIPTTEPVATVETNPVEPTGYYDPDSVLEVISEGALRLYPLNRAESTAIIHSGTDLLLASGSEATTLSALSGNNLYVSAVTNLDCYIDPVSPAFLVTQKGVTYYDEARHSLVFLDPSLKEVNQAALPEEILGHPCVSGDRKMIYYCTADALRVIDLESGLDKLLREMRCSSQSLIGMQCANTLLECLIEDVDGSTKKMFIDVQTGETVLETDASTTLRTYEDHYFAIHYDGVYPELLSGTAGQEPAMLLQKDYDADIHPVLNGNGVVTLSTAENRMTLDYFDLTTGMRTATLQLTDVSNIRSIQAEPEADCIWFLGYDSGYGSDVLYRWELLKSPAGDPHVYLTDRPSADSPDEAGLEACMQTAREISEKYGVEILLWQDAVTTQTSDYTLVPEYQVPLIQRSLEILDSALSNFPDGFLKSAAYRTDSRKMRICLVREIVSNPEAGVPENALGIQFWDENEDAFIALALGDQMEQSLYHELFHIIDSRVLSRSSAYDNWNDLNPEGFDYDYDYIKNRNRQASSWTEGDGRAFIDLYSMSFPKEDRARIMEYAMMEGNEAYFTSETMQQKLRQLCVGIRDAFRLEKSAETFRWEQYLAESLAQS